MSAAKKKPTQTQEDDLTLPEMIEKLQHTVLKDEIYRRIRPKRLFDLLGLFAYECGGQLPTPEEPVRKEREPEHVNAFQSSVIFDDSEAPPPPPPKELPLFLLLDVRDEEEYGKCHIQFAQNYPKARLSRATGMFTPEVLAFRDDPNRILIFYCDYGRISGEVAQVFAERGFTNVFLLWGGLSEFAVAYPNLVGPEAPPPPLTPSKKPSAYASGVSRAPRVTVQQRKPPSKPDPNVRKPWR